jgi:hypothetical protein
MRKSMLLTLGAAAASMKLGYLALMRPRLVRWGATDDEIARPMLGDNQIEQPLTVTNRAITIEAPPEDVWPWLAQMGEVPRGGFYSYEWIEQLMGLDVENADRILADHQSLHTGDTLDHAGNMTVRAISPGHMLVLGPPPGLWLDSTWAIAMYPTGDGHTRLVSRARVRIAKWSPFALLMLAILDPGQFIMERKFLVEVKRRAEALAQREALTIAVSEAKAEAVH